MRRTVLVLVALLAVACGTPALDEGPATSQGAMTTSGPATTAEPADADQWPPGAVLRAVEVGRRPHDPEAFTQGLEFDDGRLFESRGLYRDDEPTVLAEIDPGDGTEVVQAVTRTDGDADYFAEGLTVVDDRIIQLTWRAGTAFTYDAETLERIGTHPYEGEGWGICDEPDRLIMSDGTATLTHRDVETFEVLDTVTVDLAGRPNDDLNELECVDGLVWANLWNTNTILVIDPDSGEVVHTVDVSALADEDGRFVEDPRRGAVLNGIAHDPQSGTWLVTGKQWPWMFAVDFDCVEGCDGPDVTPSHYVRPSDPAWTTLRRS